MFKDRGITTSVAMKEIFPATDSAQKNKKNKIKNKVITK